jgi:hypothetical protein
MRDAAESANPTSEELDTESEDPNEEVVDKGNMSAAACALATRIPEAKGLRTEDVRLEV